MAGILQMVATITPSNASNNAVTWSIVPVTGNASINATGLVTASANGTVWAKAVSVSNTSVKDSMLITISNQFVPVVSLRVNTAGGIPATISTGAGTLQVLAVITPVNATNPAVTWSIVPVTGDATISSNGLITASSHGTVWAKAVSVSNPAAKDSLLVTITGQQADNNLSSLVIYPNPANESITIRLLKNHPALGLMITNGSGQVVYRASLAADRLRSLLTLDLRQLAAGFYQLTLRGNGTDVTLKFIKQ